MYACMGFTSTGVASFNGDLLIGIFYTGFALSGLFGCFFQARASAPASSRPRLGPDLPTAPPLFFGLTRLQVKGSTFATAPD